MKYIKLFEDFQSSDLTNDLIDEKITLNEYLSTIDNTLNESFSNIFDFFKNVKETILNALFTFLKQAAKVGFKILNSVISLCKLASKKILNLKQKNPNLFKIISITIMIFVLMIVTASSTYAQTTGTPVNPEKIDMTIGWFRMNDFQFSEGKEEGWKILNQCMSYLIDLKDGNIEGSFSTRVVEIADDALNTISDLSSENNEKSISSCKQLLESGKDFIVNSKGKWYGGGIGVNN